MDLDGTVDPPRRHDAAAPLDVTADGPRVAGTMLDATTARPQPGWIDGTAATPQRWSDLPDQRFVRGTSVGRYVLLDSIGAGGMGQVFAAYDPELDRKVAIKLVLSTGFEAESRLLREAQALARLAHPNVVAIHDVGIHGGSVWLAMEFVVGQTLGAWARAAPRPWSDQLRVLLDTARGVAAAHAAGLVHRDLKPDNVMLGDDGRVRVMDFGLVHGHVAAADRDASPDSAAANVELTRAGDVLGTPAYMAPEQWRGEDAGAPADQFGWSVMAWELLHGERPFAGESFENLAAAVLAGVRRPPPRDRRVPRWLRRIVERGLTGEPIRRWPDMAALVHALERGRSLGRRRIVLALVLIFAALVGAALGARRWQVAAQVAACEAAGAEIRDIWNDDARQRLRAAFTATDLGYRDTAIARTLEYLDAHASAWQAARTEVCRSADIDRTWRPDVAERAVGCLEQRRLELEVRVDAFTRADASTVEAAVEAASTLPPIAPCLDEAQLLRGLAPPHADAELRALRVVLARADILQATGKLDEAAAAAAESRTLADALAWPPAQAEARMLVGALHHVRGETTEALREYRAAYLAAARAGAWTVATEAALALAVTLEPTGAGAEMQGWIEHAEVALAHAGDATGLLAAHHRTVLAHADIFAGAMDEALTHQSEALALVEAALGSGNHPRIAECLFDLAYIHYIRGDFAAARPMLERSVAIQETALGATHPHLVAPLELLASVVMELGDPGLALALALRGVAIVEATFGPSHPGLATSLGFIGEVHAFLGHYREAVAVAGRALAISEQDGEHKPGLLAVPLLALAESHTTAGEFAAARPLFERALALSIQVFGPDHEFNQPPRIGLARALAYLGQHERAAALFEQAAASHPEGGSLRTLIYFAALKLRMHDVSGARDLLTRAESRSHDPRAKPDEITAMHEALGLLHTTTGDPAAARAAFEQAIARAESTHGPSHPLVAHHLVRLAGTLLAEGASQPALTALERALAISEALPPAPRTRARLHFYLARALVDTDGDLARAVAAATLAREGFREPGAADELAEVEAWLARHRL